MPALTHFRTAKSALQQLAKASRRSHSSSTPPNLSASSSTPRHFLSIADVTPAELEKLVCNASIYKHQIKKGAIPKSIQGSLNGKSVAMIFNKRSTRTRVSTEAAVHMLGGHPMFLGKEDIQLGVNESLYDTSRVISSMTSCMVARVGPHSDVVNLAKDSSVPVINALSDSFHPLQTIADFATIHEAFNNSEISISGRLNVAGLKIAWVGDANNVLFDLAIACMKLGVHISVAAPEGYTIPSSFRKIILAAGEGIASQGTLLETTVPEEAIKDADILVTDTWVSMGQEGEATNRIKAFRGYQITTGLAKRGGAKEGWKFMHCLPRHAAEVADEVFYSDRSLVFPEAENRLWAAISVLDAFLVKKGVI